MNSINHEKSATAFGAYLLTKATANDDEIELTENRYDPVRGAVMGKSVAGTPVIQKTDGLVTLIADGAILKGAPICPSDNVDGAAASATQDAVGDYVNICGYAVQAAADGEEFLAILDPDSYPLTTGVPGAQSGNDINILIQPTRPGVKYYLASVLEADGTRGDTAAFVLSEDGIGAEVTDTNKGNLIFSVNGTDPGYAVLSCTRVSGAFTGTVYVIVEPLNHAGVTVCIPVTFT